MQTTTFHGKNNATETIVETVASTQKPGIAARKRDNWSDVLIKVPQLLPSFLQGCSVIDLDYTVQVLVTCLKIFMCAFMFQMYIYMYVCACVYIYKINIFSYMSVGHMLERHLPDGRLFEFTCTNGLFHE